MKTHPNFLRCAAILCSIVCLTQSFLMAKAAETYTAADVKTGDVICFGTPDEASGFDGKWLVLDPSKTNTGADGMFLTTLNLVGSADGSPLLFREIGDVSVSFSDRGEAYAAEHPGVTDYRGSDLQLWCAAFPEKYLSDAETLALLPTYLSDEAIVIPGFTIPLPGAANGTVDFDPAPEVLDGDQIFILSVKEATNESYGFADNRSRVAFFKGTEGGYFLRSPHIPTFPLDVGFVFSFGAVMDYPVNAKSLYEMSTYARSACNLDSSKITNLEALATADGRTIWRASFEGGEANNITYDLSLPVVGEVMDLAGMIRTAFIVVVVVLVLLLALIVRGIVRFVRKRKA